MKIQKITGENHESYRDRSRARGFHARGVHLYDASRRHAVREECGAHLGLPEGLRASRTHREGRHRDAAPFPCLDRMPKNFEELGAKEEDIGKLAHTCCFGSEHSDGKVHGFMTLEEKDIEAIYRLML